MDKNLEIIETICAQLYKGIGQDRVFQKQKENKVFERFLSKMYRQFGQQSVGEQFLWDFLSFNMEKLYGRKTMFGSMVMLNWLLSDKSIKRWKEEKTESSEYFSSKFLQENNIQKQVTYEKVDLEDLEEMERGRFFNTEVGFLNCQSLASYNEFSEYCIKCNFKKECKNEKDI